MAQEAMKLESDDTAKNLVDMLLAKGATPSTVGARYKVNGQWRDVTWGELIGRVRSISEALVGLGLKPQDRVAIFAPTRFEWSLMHFAVNGAGATVVPIYASNTPAEAEYIINNSGARFVVLDHDKPESKLPGRWSRLKEAGANTPSVERYIAFELSSDPEARLLSLADLEQQGAALLEKNPNGLEERSANVSLDELSVVLYTSGTTGNPKGVMLNHRAWVSQGKAIAQIKVLEPTDVVLLALPLAHSFAMVVQFAWLSTSCVMAYAEAIEKLADNAGEVQCTVLPAVPRIFEKAYSKVVNDGSSAPGIKGKLFRWAMRQFEEYVSAKAAGREYSSLQWSLAKKLVFSKVEAKLGARFGGRMRLFISGSAPLSPKIQHFFQLCGMTILEGYGLTETSAATHVNRLGRVKVGTVGTSLPGFEIKLAEDKEILARGPGVMTGYFNMPEETKAVLQADGWFHTGDIGEIDSDGYLRITDRKKDLIKTSGGKYIAPQELENALKAAEPIIGFPMIHGDKRNFVSLLVTISEETVTTWANESGIKYSSYAELTQRPEVRAKVQAAVDGINAGQPSYATIKKFAILDHDWTMEGGELTPTLKVKRKVVSQNYKKTLDEFYGGESFD